MKRECIYIFLFLILFNPTINAQNGGNGLPVNQQIKLILTTLKYDNNFMSQLGKEINIGIFAADNPVSQKYKKEFLKVFESDYSKKTFYKRPFTVTSITDTHALSLADCDLVIIAPGSKDIIKDILTITKKKKIISATGISEYLNSGISIVVGLKDKKNFLAINLKNAKNENCDFSSRILKLALIVE